MFLFDIITDIKAYARGRFLDKVWKIDTNLYQSGDLEDKVAPLVVDWNDFYGIVDLEGGRDPRDVLKKVKDYRHIPIPDGPLPWDPRVNRITLIDWWKHAENVNAISLSGKKMLIHCGAGRNRASLFSGCVMFLRGPMGWEIVKYMRKKRPHALDNNVFATYLGSLLRRKK